MTYHDWVISRKAPDAGLSPADVDDLYQHVAEVARSNALETDSRMVLNWLVACGPEKAKARLALLRGEKLPL